MKKAKPPLEATSLPEKRNMLIAPIIKINVIRELWKRQNMCL